MRLTITGVLAALVLLGCSRHLEAQEQLPRVIVDDTLRGPVPPLLTSPSTPISLGVRLQIAPDQDELPGLDERLAIYARHRIPLWLAVHAPSSADDVERWRGSLQRLLGKLGEDLVVLEVVAAERDPRLAAFALRLAATDTRAGRESVGVALGGDALLDPAFRASIFSAGIGPYFDLLAVPDVPLQTIVTELETVNQLAQVVVAGRGTASGPEAPAERIVDAVIEALGTSIVAHVWQPSAGLEAAIRALAPIGPLLRADISALDSEAASLRIDEGQLNVTGSVRHRLLFDSRTFGTYLVYWSEAAPDPLQLSLTLPIEGIPVLRRLADGSTQQAADYSRDPETGVVRMTLPRAGGAVLVDFNAGASEVFAERSDVSAERQLTVGEIIARHQQQRRAQDRLVRNYIATVRMSQHFRPTMTDPGYDVVTENRYYVAEDGIEWEELSFSVNGSRWGADRPPFPLLQPEKVLSLPLQLRFDSDYKYTLAGTERVGNYTCYVVRFEPTVDAQSMYRGTVWIDRRTFARVKVQAVQTRLSAPVVSNEEVQTYAPVTAAGNQPVFLFAGLEARQIMLIAGRNLLVEKTVVFDAFRVNDPTFEAARAEARRSDRIMYRETDRGLRYYVKEGERRVVSDRPTRTARAMAMGVTLDPSYSFPLPIFGINYLNFEFLGRPDTQLALLFGGVLAAGNLQRPRLGGSPLDASVDFFAIAVPSSDRVYDADGEREGERVLTWPLTTGVNLGWQYTPFQKVIGQYHFRFDGFVRDTTTAESFTVPASTVTHGLGGGWEYRRGGYSLLLNGTWFARPGWRAWGIDGTTATGPRRRFARYTASLSRDFHLNVFHKVRLNAAWFGGRDLDRFAKYQFGMFDDTRIHGVPASGVRFEELTMLRGAYSFNIFDQYRLDLFFEQAWGRDRALDPGWQRITGLGAALNFRAVWGTILRADVGRSILPHRYRGVGSTTLQIMLLKPLR